VFVNTAHRVNPSELDRICPQFDYLETCVLSRKESEIKSGSLDFSNDRDVSFRTHAEFIGLSARAADTSGAFYDNWMCGMPASSPAAVWWIFCRVLRKRRESRRKKSTMSAADSCTVSLSRLKSRKESMFNLEFWSFYHYRFISVSYSLNRINRSSLY